MATRGGGGQAISDQSKLDCRRPFSRPWQRRYIKCSVSYVPIYMKRMLLAGIGLGTCLAITLAANGAAPEKVTKKEGKVLAVDKAGQGAPFEKAIVFPGQV